MDLDCAFEFGISRDVIKQNRKDWTLAHDVKLLKYLEKFSQSLISRAGDAVKSLEEFEKDLYFVSLNIQTVSQRFQSLANKQFIEHCVLEDDISAYSKAPENKVDISSSASNLLLNNALASCLTSFNFKYNTYKDGYSVNKSNHVPGTVNSDRRLPPLIGTLDFSDYYDHLLSSKEYFGKPMKKSEVNSEDNFSDKQSIHDSISLCSSSNVVQDNDFNNTLFENHGHLDDASSSSNLSREQQDRNEDFSNKVLDKNIKHTDSRGWVHQENSFFNSNGYDNIVPSQHNSLFDDNDECDDDLFLFGKTMPFSVKAFTEENDEIPHSASQGMDEGDGEAINRNTFPQSNTSSHRSIAVVANNDRNKKVSNDDICSNRTDKLSGDPDAKLILPYSSSNISKNVQMDNEQNSVTHSQSVESNLLAFESSSDFESVVSSKEESSKTSFLVPDSSKKFSLFSDHDESDDELFSSVKQKQAKDNFKRVLEEKMLVHGTFKDIIKSTAKVNKNNISNANGSLRNEHAARNICLDLPVGIHEESGFPNYDAPMLQSLVKNRPKIRNKRRPPSRKHLKGFHSANSNSFDNTKEEGTSNNLEQLSDQLSSNTFSVLSPSTEEEDLFIVPTTSMTHEVSCSNLFLASSLLSPGSSLDNQNLNSNFVCEDKSIDDASSSISATENSKEDSGSSKDNTVLSSELSPPTVTVASNKKVIKKIEPTSNAFWNNRISLFNDSEDEDDLFSTSNNKKHYDRKPSEIKTSSTSASNNHSKVGKDIFKDVFSNDSDDDDLFKVKESTIFTRSKPDSLFTKIKDENESSKNESNGNKLLKGSTKDFKDPLSCFDEHQAD